MTNTTLPTANLQTKADSVAHTLVTQLRGDNGSQSLSDIAYNLSVLQVNEEYNIKALFTTKNLTEEKWQENKQLQGVDLFRDFAPSYRGTTITRKEWETDGKYAVLIRLINELKLNNAEGDLSQYLVPVLSLSRASYPMTISKFTDENGKEAMYSLSSLVPEGITAIYTQVFLPECRNTLVPAMLKLVERKVLTAQEQQLVEMYGSYFAHCKCLANVRAAFKEHQKAIFLKWVRNTYLLPNLRSYVIAHPEQFPNVQPAKVLLSADDRVSDAMIDFHANFGGERVYTGIRIFLNPRYDLAIEDCKTENLTARRFLEHVLMQSLLSTTGDYDYSRILSKLFDVNFQVTHKVGSEPVISKEDAAEAQNINRVEDIAANAANAVDDLFADIFSDDSLQDILSTPEDNGESTSDTESNPEDVLDEANALLNANRNSRVMSLVERAKAARNKRNK